ncbi:MAG: DNA repair protein RecN [Methylococcales bacterium]
MLRSLSIRDLAVVATLDLDLNQGLTVLTGETGAGKSILLTALGLALGERADSSYVRPDCLRAEINLDFDISAIPAAQQWLEDNALDEEDQCLIRRIVGADGRSKAFVNGRPITLQSLQSLTSHLVEIHGQHAHLTLLKSEEQRRLLDESAGNTPLQKKVSTLFQQWNDTRTALKEMVQQTEDQAAREELLRFQIDELNQLDFTSLDYSALVEEFNRHANLDKILATGQHEINRLYDDEQFSLNSQLGQAIDALSEISEIAPEYLEVTQMLNDAQIQIQESVQQLRRQQDQLESDPQRLKWLDEQLAVIHSLARKHQIAPEQLPQTFEEFNCELGRLTHSTEKIDELQQSLKAIESQYEKAANDLSNHRKKYAKILDTEITAIIRTLGMPEGEFHIKIENPPDPQPKPHGIDQIEYFIRTNPGLPSRPLGKTASGGELSRISLAIQVAATHSKATPTMIFDEVDAGIGGGVAEIVGQRLRNLADNKQLLCVTHLPQVAAQGHHHLMVTKNSEQHSTQTEVKLLSENQREQEIARMLGGVKITPQTLAHAQEMLQWPNNENTGT